MDCHISKCIKVFAQKSEQQLGTMPNKALKCVTQNGSLSHPSGAKELVAAADSVTPMAAEFLSEVTYSPESETIYVAFKAYHAMKMGHRELINKAINSNKFDRVHVLLLEYLRCYASESSLRLYAS